MQIYEELKKFSEPESSQHEEAFGKNKDSQARHQLGSWL